MKIIKSLGLVASPAFFGEILILLFVLRYWNFRQERIQYPEGFWNVSRQ
jgi:uncharacterized membrane protein